MQVNEYAKHFFLYAKGWYRRSEDPWKDLKKLRGIHFLTVDGKEEKDLILNKITQCAIECILEHPKHRTLTEFQELLTKLSPNYWLRNFNKPPKPYVYETELLEICLNIMRFSNIENLNPDKDCRFDVLPSPE